MTTTISGTSGASTALTLSGGTAGQIPYQSAPGTTSFIANGTSGQALLSNGAGAPSFGQISSIGVGQSWTVNPPSSGTNNTGKPIMITAFIRIVNSASVSVNGTTIMSMGAWSGYFSITFVVPPTHTYAITAPDGIQTSAMLS